MSKMPPNERYAGLSDRRMVVVVEKPEAHGDPPGDSGGLKGRSCPLLASGETAGQLIKHQFVILVYNLEGHFQN